MFHGIKRLFLPVMDKFYANILNKSEIAINEQILNK